jgi:hypothetical protein
MSSAVVAKPQTNEYAAYYEKYVSLVPEGNVIDLLEQQLDKTLALLGGLTEEQGNYRYAPDKWSIKELVGHVSDTERIFAYRLLRFARNDKNALAGFEQDGYIVNAEFDSCRLSDLVKEFEYVRRSSLALLRHLPQAAWQRQGVASDNEVSVRALAYILAGHELHHLKVLSERYL